MICLVWSAVLRTLLGHGHSEAAPKQLSRHSKKEQAVLVETNIKHHTLSLSTQEKLIAKTCWSLLVRNNNPHPFRKDSAARIESFT